MTETGREIAMRCTSCGRRWSPASINTTSAPCVCGNSKYEAEVASGDFPDGSQVAAEWSDLPDLGQASDEGKP